MNKQAFLDRLRDGLSGLPREDVEERLTFYSEMIDDRMEDGLSEEEAVAEIGSVDAIAAQLIEETPPDEDKSRPKRRLRAWEVVLLVLGSPLWLSVLAAAFAAVLTAFLTVWVVILSLWVVELALIGGFLIGAAAGVLFLMHGGVRKLVLFGAGLVLAGLAVFLFFGCRAATKGGCALTKRITRYIKSWFAERRMQHEAGN